MNKPKKTSRRVTFVIPSAADVRTKAGRERIVAPLRALLDRVADGPLPGVSMMTPLVLKAFLPWILAAWYFPMGPSVTRRITDSLPLDLFARINAGEKVQGADRQRVMNALRAAFDVWVQR